MAVIVFLIGGLLVYKSANSGYEYTLLENDTWELSKYNGKKDTIKIPAKRWGKPVTKIGNSCFNWQSTSTLYVDIPETVIEIDGWAFEGCKNLTITGGENVKTIGTSAFIRCIFASDFSFPNELTYIGLAAFKDTNLKKAILSEGVEYIGFSAFESSMLEEVYIPESVSYIGANAFSFTPWIEKQSGYTLLREDIIIQYPDEEIVSVPNGIKMISISKGEMSTNSAVREIRIPTTVEKIVGRIVGTVESPLIIYIPASVESILYYEDYEGDKKLVGSGDENVTYVVEKGSYGEQYAAQMAKMYGSKVEVVEKIEY